MTRPYDPARRRTSEHGSATVYALAITVLIVLLAVAAIQITMFFTLKHRVSAAADMSAIAASKAEAAGRDGCAAAKRLARRSHVQLAACQMDYEVATVTATARAKSWWAIRMRAEVKARAAPVEYVN